MSTFDDDTVTGSELTDELRDVIFRVCREFAKRDRRKDDELSKQDSFSGIGECLEWRALDQFDARQLVVLETLITYWREAEVCVPGVSQPRPWTDAENDEGILLSMRHDTLLFRTGALRRKTANEELWEQSNPDPGRLYGLHVLASDRPLIEIDGANFVGGSCLRMAIDEADLQALKTNAVGTPTIITDRRSKKPYVVRRVAGDVWLELVSELDQSA
jgi:hypothetical protein